MLPADAFFLDDNLGTTATSRHIALDGDPSPTVTEAQKLAYYWRWLDTPTMEPQFLCLGVVDQDVSAAFDTTQGRDVIFNQVAFDRKGQPNVAHPRDGKQFVYTKPTAPILISAVFSTPNVVLTFDASGEGLIHIQRRRGTDEFADIATAVYTDTTYNDSPALNDTYDYRLTQEGQTGESMTRSVVVTGLSSSVGSPPDTLADDGGTDDGTSVAFVLTWVNHSGTGLNYIQRRTLPSGAYDDIDSVSSGTATYTDTIDRGILGRAYAYRIRNASVGGFSNEITVHVPSV